MTEAMSFPRPDFRPSLDRVLDLGQVDSWPPARHRFDERSVRAVTAAAAYLTAAAGLLAGLVVADKLGVLPLSVWTESGVYGMVTLDAPEPKSLDAGDVALTELVAEFMSAAFEAAQDQDAPPPPP